MPAAFPPFHPSQLSSPQPIVPATLPATNSFDPDHQLRVGPAAHAVDELQQVQRRLQLLVAQVAEAEPGALTGEVGPPLVQVAVGGKASVFVDLPQPVLRTKPTSLTRSASCDRPTSFPLDDRPLTASAARRSRTTDQSESSATPIPKISKRQLVCLVFEVANRHTPCRSCGSVRHWLCILDTRSRMLDGQLMGNLVERLVSSRWSIPNVPGGPTPRCRKPDRRE